MHTGRVAERDAVRELADELLVAGALQLDDLERVEAPGDVGEAELRHVRHDREADLGAARVGALHVPDDRVDALEVGEGLDERGVGDGHDEGMGSHGATLTKAGSPAGSRSSTSPIGSVE